MAQHFPVMLAETLEYLAVRPDGRYLDCTAGLGGHTRAIAERLTAGGKVIANDRDAQSLDMARRNTADFADRIEYRHGAFSELDEAGLDGFGSGVGTPRLAESRQVAMEWAPGRGHLVFACSRRPHDYGAARRSQEGRDRQVQTGERRHWGGPGAGRIDDDLDREGPARGLDAGNAAVRSTLEAGDLRPPLESDALPRGSRAAGPTGLHPFSERDSRSLTGLRQRRLDRAQPLLEANSRRGFQ